jgi:hypothetical protein
MTDRDKHNEAWLEAWFRVAVRRAGGYTVKLAPTEAGVPDRLVVLPRNRMYLVELKTSTGTLSAIQKAWHRRFYQLGTVVHVLYGREDAAMWIMDPDNKLGRPRRRG